MNEIKHWFQKKDNTHSDQLKLNQDNFSNKASSLKSLPSPDTLAYPVPPKVEDLDKYGRVEEVLLKNVLSTQTQRQWERFNAGDHPDELFKGYIDNPVAVKLIDGKFLLFDGHHRTELALNNEIKEMTMFVIDAKDYAPRLNRMFAKAIDTTDYDKVFEEINSSKSKKPFI